ncbi:MFS transporter [Sphingomonas solaris]|uniref:MFS transporter n=1 Tax=Alterirhizorhabdus solaris TaxID=2529389 RepID=A0A558R9E7_9SPHN|nr:MFS transporter [Sphingomonas solaris]TVV76011.1 MFS transporter [Sphingomonas solaris]
MTGLPLPRRYLAILAVSAGNALVTMDSSIATVALPSIARALAVPASSVLLVVTVYQLVLVMTLLPFSNLGERFGLRRLYQGGLALFTVATVLCFFAKSLPFLLVVRAAQALGAAAALSVSPGLVRQIYPQSQLGRGLSLNTLVVTSASALAPTIGGVVLGLAPWPWVFASAVPFAALSLLFGRNLPAASPRSDPFDVLGAVLCAATLGLTIAGLETAVHGDSPVVSAAIVVAGLAIGVVFVRRELGEPRPIIPVDLLAQPALALSLAGSFAASLGSMLLMLSLPFRLQQQYGFSPGAVGAVLAPWPLTMMVVAPIAGALSDRYPPRAMGAIGMAIATTALVLIAFLPAHPDFFDIAWRMVLCGMGYGLFLSPNARLVIGAAPIERAASAGGMVATNRLIAQTMGATLVAALLSHGLGSGPLPPLIGAGLALLAGLCSLAHVAPVGRVPAEVAERL